MQVLIRLPDPETSLALSELIKELQRPICGVPLLARVIATAERSGATEVLLLHSIELPGIWLKERLESIGRIAIPLRLLPLEQPFHHKVPEDWQSIAPQLAEKFLWLPWNYIADRRQLSRMIAAGQGKHAGVRFVPQADGQWVAEAGIESPFVLTKEALSCPHFKDKTLPSENWWQQVLAESAMEEIPVAQAPGFVVNSAATAREAERELVRRSGKETDGIFSTFNRRLCRPLVRGLAKTPITPNAITFIGLGVSLLSGYWYAQGYYAAYVLGGLLYFVSVLFDEMDGMLARLKFRESAFGCWLETFVDYASYVVLFVGMTIGLYRQSGLLWLALGGLLMAGTWISFFAVSYQRKLATAPDRPNEYLQRFHRTLEADSGNALSRFGRLTEFVIRKAPLSHFIPIFTLLGGLKLLFLLAVLSSNLVWLFALYFNRLFHPAISADSAQHRLNLSFSIQSEKGKNQ